MSTRRFLKTAEHRVNKQCSKIPPQAIIPLHIYFSHKKVRKIHRNLQRKVCFLQISKLFVCIIIFKKVRPLISSFLPNTKKIRPPIFQVAQICMPPLFSYAAEISAPWQPWFGLHCSIVERVRRYCKWECTYM
jgi:hypothetical protein